VSPPTPPSQALTAHHARRARARYHARFLSCGTRAFVTLGGGHGETSSEHASLRSARGFFFFLVNGEPSRRRATSVSSFLLVSGAAARRGGGVHLEAVRSAAPRRGKARLRKRAKARSARRSKARTRFRFEGSRGVSDAARDGGARTRPRRGGFFFGGAPRGRLSEPSVPSALGTSAWRAACRGRPRDAQAALRTCEELCELCARGDGDGRRLRRRRAEPSRFNTESAPRARPAAAAAAAAYGPQTRAPGAQRLCVRP